MIHIQAPEPVMPSIVGPTLFLAGGISNCPNWQQEIVEHLHPFEGTVFNPRRDVFDLSDTAATQIQIEWEFYTLRKADAILFWFPKESICPIALYELGTWTSQSKPLLIGIHPEYTRSLDVMTQTGLARPECPIYPTFDALTNAVCSWLNASSQSK